MDAVGAISAYFGAERDPERAERFSRVLPLERMHAGWAEDAIVGGAGAFPFEFSIPGGSVPCAGITVVGVLPTHRRRGVLRELMRTQLEDVHARGEPIAALWASEMTIYGRFGYGWASLAGEIDLPRERTAFAAPFERRGSFRIVDADEAFALFPPVWNRVWEQTPGLFKRSEHWWRDRAIFDRPERREGGSPKMRVVLELDGSVEGYAMYHHHPGWEAGSTIARLRIVEALAATPEATRELWRYLLDIDWVARIEASLLPPDHSLFFLLADSRRGKYRMGDGLWVRLVDVGASLSARAYGSDELVVLEVEDAFCPWNTARWRVEGGTAEQTDELSDLRVPVDALGSVYLGGFTFSQLARGLRVEELRPGALERADRIFQTSTPHPWCPEIF